MSTFLREVSIDELDAIATCLVEAFRTDTMMKYLIECDNNTPAQQDAVAFAMFKYLHSALFLSGGQVFAIVDTENPARLIAIASWMPPGTRFDDGYLMFLRSGMWRFKYLLGPQTRTRFFGEYAAVAGGQQIKLTEGRDVWFLYYLGALPEARGKGHSKTLIEFISKQADATKHPLYLEASSEFNADFVYSKRGFVEKGDMMMGADGGLRLRLPCMIRMPK